MLEWIVTIVALIGVIITIVGLIRAGAKKEESHAAAVVALGLKMDNMQNSVDARFNVLSTRIDDVKKVIGNGGIHGLRQDIQDMKENCAGEMSTMKEKISANTKDIDELKERR